MNSLVPGRPVRRNHSGPPSLSKRIDMRHRFRIRKPRYIWYRCVGSDVHEYALRGNCPFAAVAQSDLESTRSGELSIRPNQFSAGCLILIDMDFDQVLYHFSLSRIDADHVDGDRSSFYPEFLVSTKQRGDLRSVNDVLARQAGDIWTCPPRKMHGRDPDQAGR